ncbi:MAG: hypothetical protein NTX07_03125 [Solirubrobacterales bacterium]|nr:hypothetical protein [Solirubrobacterales bacterium]
MSITPKRIAAILAVAALAVAPAAALADSGGDQYCDPFGGCGVNGGSGSGGAHHGGKKKPSVSSKPAQTPEQVQFLNQIGQSLRDRSLRAQGRAAAASAPGSPERVAWLKAYRLSRTGAVLDAAGLSAMRLAIPSS